MKRILLLGLVAALSACALPGKPGPLPARSECRIQAHGLACSEVPYGPDHSGIVVHE